MPVTTELSRRMIEDYLREREFEFALRDEHPTIYLEPAEGRSCYLLVTFVIDQEAGEKIYQVGVLSDYMIPKKNWGKAVLACNTWNMTHRWPKAFLDVEGDAAEGQVVLECSFDLKPGIHKELLHQMTDGVVYGAHEFWAWANSEKKF